MQTSNSKQPHFLLFVFSLQALTGIALVFNIPFARQILGFLFLTFIPGFVLLKLLRLYKPQPIETVIFSAGLSLAFLMFIGFIADQLGSLNILSEPLSTGPMALIINISVSLVCITNYLTNKDAFNILDTGTLKKLLPSMLYLLLPLLSMIGVIFAVTQNNNALLLFVTTIIPIIIVIGSFSSRLSSHYPAIIFAVALTLLLSATLITKYVYGPDIGLEYNVFKQTQNISSLNWQPIFFEQLSYKSMLSVTVLPTIYSNLLNLDGNWVFKIIFSIIFSLVPLALFQLYQIKWDKKVAFISVFFFMANYMFYGLMIHQAKQMIGELFLVLFFLAILRENGNFSRSKWVLTTVFVFGIIVSHYSIAYIFMFMLLGTVIIGKFFFKDKKMKMTATVLLFSLTLIFFWYTAVVQAPFDNFVSKVQTISETFVSEFFYSGSRGQSVQLALGLLESPTLLHDIGRYIHNLTSVLIIVGFLAMFSRWRKDKRDSEFVTITTLSMFLLLAALIVPRFASFLEMSRVYQIALLFISPLFVIGIETLWNIPQRLRRSEKKHGYQLKGLCLALIMIIVVAFFLFQTGFFYEIYNDPEPSSLTLSRYKMQGSFDLIQESDVYSASWLSNYGNVDQIVTISDTVSLLRVLTSYSTLDRRMIRLMANSTEPQMYSERYFASKEVGKPDVSYVYLRKYNVEEEKIVYNMNTNLQFNFSEIPILNSTDILMNRIYSNSASEVYFRSP
jgi:uncharacterized membrane protein